MDTLLVIGLVVFLVVVFLIPTARDRAQAEFWEKRQRDLDNK